MVAPLVLLVTVPIESRLSIPPSFPWKTCPELPEGRESRGIPTPDAVIPSTTRDLALSSWTQALRNRMPVLQSEIPRPLLRPRNDSFACVGFFLPQPPVPSPSPSPLAPNT